VRVRRIEEKRGWAVRVAVAILKPTLLAATTRTWLDGHKVPASGGCVVVVNHISYVDPLLSALFLYDHGRIPRYLAKSSLFRNRHLGAFLGAAGQIPVERLTRNAIGAYDAAVRAVRDGECVVVYPEGTLTRDPALWPMKGKTGAARIALATGCPVIPVGQWGAQDLLPPYARKPDLLPRKHVTMKVGDPVDLADLVARKHTAEVVSEATDRIMVALTALVADLRDEEPPSERFDARRHGLKETGNPHEDARRARRRQRP
jgi:1-acyl-sn-glycerol-3-phosphate acyltransferase